MHYNHREIEQKWQAYWEANNTFAVDEKSSKPKYYVLDMFPYPSGSGLHVGHVEGYTASDIVARHKRQQGYEVLHPMGWDSFGLPAEQYAIRTGTHPAITTQQNIDTYRRQLRSLGFSYDWSREFATSDPTYYKWTQWIFTLLYERGLAYEAEMQVNYCPALGTVLANEEIENGCAIEGGHPVERRPLKQWMLKITAYAEQLLDDLEELDWPQHLKKLQTNWIGKSSGAEIQFELLGSTATLPVFTTRPDTLFGVTYMVLAPEHPLVDEIASNGQREAIADYRASIASKSDLERTDLNEEKSGVFTGGFAIHPVTGEPLPVWISDYVLISYGSGAIMAVPAHDERDFAFAQQYQLPIRPVYEPNEAELEQLFPEPQERALLRKSIAEGKACWSGGGLCTHSRAEGIILDGLQVNEAKEAMIEWLNTHGHGKRTTNYKLRDWLFARQRYWGEPFPILHLADGTRRTLSIDELPLCPPEMVDFAPTGDGRGPLARAEEWVYIKDPKSGQAARRDINTMPQWAGSCWYYLRFCDPHNTQEAWSLKAASRWLPVDLYIGGVEHAVLHLLYSRFWHKVLYDCGLVPTKEPFKCLRNQGMITARSYQKASGAYVDPKDVVEKNATYFHKESGELLRSQIDKMSKSKLNGVTPDEIISSCGADSLRLYEMFMGPLDKEKVWISDAVSGCYRFLKRFYDFAISPKLTDEPSLEAKILAHRTVDGVCKDIEALQFNTAIAKMMEFANAFSKLESYPRESLAMVTQVLMPFAPHLAEEVWELLGKTSSISLAPLPAIDPELIKVQKATYAIQINGKLRGQCDMPLNATQDDVVRASSELDNVKRLLDGQSLQKVIFVPNRLLNFVLKA